MTEDVAVADVATLKRPATHTKAGRPTAEEAKARQSERARIVGASLGQANLTRFAHENGLRPATLSNWRSQARDGNLEVAPRVREALRAEMPGRTFRRTGARRKARVVLSDDAAARAVIDSIHSGKAPAEVAKAHNISESQLHQLRARARHGLLEIPMVERAMLGSRGTTRSRAVEATVKASPKAPAKSRKPAAQAAPTVEPTVETAVEPTVAPVAAPSAAPQASAQGIVVRKKDATIEIPATLSPEQMAAAVSAALAA